MDKPDASQPPKQYNNEMTRLVAWHERRIARQSAASKGPEPVSPSPGAEKNPPPTPPSKPTT